MHGGSGRWKDPDVQETGGRNKEEKGIGGANVVRNA